MRMNERLLHTAWGTRVLSTDCGATRESNVSLNNYIASIFTVDHQLPHYCFRRPLLCGVSMENFLPATRISRMHCMLRTREYRRRRALPPCDLL